MNQKVLNTPHGNSSRTKIPKWGEDKNNQRYKEVI